jgi:phosphatidylglycerol:prolipoprotein diacylglycerol transferase
MLPNLLKIGPLTIKTYGVFVALGFLLSINYLRTQSKKFNIATETILDLTLFILISGIIGARILYVLLNWQFYKNNLTEILAIWSGGLVLYGGLLMGTIFVIIYSKIKKIELLKLGDLLAPAIFLGISIGRIGCFCAGCCYGKETNLPWGVVFNNPLSLAPIGIKIHPTQIYESIFCFILFVILHKINLNILSTIDKSKIIYGRTFFISILIYSIYRFFIEYIRNDNRGPLILGLFPSQLISIIFIIISVPILILLQYRRIKLKQ